MSFSDPCSRGAGVVAERVWVVGRGGGWLRLLLDLWRRISWESGGTRLLVDTELEGDPERWLTNSRRLPVEEAGVSERDWEPVNGSWELLWFGEGVKGRVVELSSVGDADVVRSSC